MTVPLFSHIQNQAERGQKATVVGLTLLRRSPLLTGRFFSLNVRCQTVTGWGVGKLNGERTKEAERFSLPSLGFSRALSCTFSQNCRALSPGWCLPPCFGLSWVQTRGYPWGTQVNSLSVWRYKLWSSPICFPKLQGFQSPQIVTACILYESQDGGASSRTRNFLTGAQHPQRSFQQARLLVYTPGWSLSVNTTLIHTPGFSGSANCGFMENPAAKTWVSISRS